MKTVKTSSNMSNKSSTSQKRMRACPHRDSLNKDPRRYTPCKDLDCRDDLTDYRQNERYWLDLWCSFYYPQVRRKLSSKQRQQYSDKYERCQRLMNKGFKIGDEIRDHKRTMIEEWQLGGWEGLGTSVREQVLRRVVLKQILESKKEGMKAYYDSIRSKVDFPL